MSGCRLELGVLHSAQLQAMQKAVAALPAAEATSPAAVQAAIAGVRAQPSASFLSSDAAVDWALLSSAYVPSRSASDLRLQWRNRLDPRINHSPFTAEEDRGIVSLAASLPWLQLAQQLGTNRTAIACMCRFVRSLSTEMIRSSPWTADEDDRLRAVVEQGGGSARLDESQRAHARPH